MQWSFYVRDIKLNDIFLCKTRHAVRQILVQKSSQWQSIPFLFLQVLLGLRLFATD